MLVACFHVWFGWVSGGVDVFLTLSGYFFLGSLLRHTISAQKPGVSFRTAVNPRPRLSRLLRRLLPALITVLLAVTLLTVLILPQTRWVDIGREVIERPLFPELVSGGQLAGLSGGQFHEQSAAACGRWRCRASSSSSPCSPCSPSPDCSSSARGSSRHWHVRR